MKDLFPAKRRPRVGFVFYRNGATEKSTRYGGFVSRLKKYGGLDDVDTEYFALEDLVYEINGNIARIYQQGKKYELGECDYVYIKSWSGAPDRAAALANFLDGKGIPYADSLVAGKGRTKLTTHFRLWSEGIPVIPSIFASKNKLLDLEIDSFPVVVKAVNGQKGQDNYMVRSKEELSALVSKDLSEENDYVVQDFIENQGDYRTQVYGYEVVMGMKRIGSGETHLNNTSAGGRAEYLAPDIIPEEIKDLSSRAAQAMQLEVCGADIITDSITGKSYVMEVNQGSQVVTGLFSKENSTSLSNYIKRMASPRYIRSFKQHRRLGVVGRCATVSLDDLDICKMAARVDTGAYVSSLHAEEIEVIEKNGKRLLRFVVPTERDRRSYEVTEFGEVEVRNAHGTTKRYTINTRVKVQGVTVLTSFNLSGRGELKFPVLLGRKFLRGRFIVNPEIGLGEELKK